MMRDIVTIILERDRGCPRCRRKPAIGHPCPFFLTYDLEDVDCIGFVPEDEHLPRKEKGNKK